MVPPQSPTWALAEGIQLLWREWGEAHVAYDSGSGSTHLFDPVTSIAIQHLQRHPARLADLVSHVSLRLEVEADQTLRNQLEQALAKLETLGILEANYQ